MSPRSCARCLPGRTQVMPILDADGRLVDFASLDTLGAEQAVTMKLSDWVFRFLADLGVKHVFMLTGGGAMHLNDSLGPCRDIEYVCTLHEQAAAMAAESYAKVIGDIGVCLVTAGPGGTNAITGVAGAWLDSTPMLVLSGQAKRADLKGNSGVRQMGVQEVDIVSMVGADHQVRRDGDGAGGDPLSPREGRAPRAHRTARPGLARPAARRAGRDDRRDSRCADSIPDEAAIDGLATGARGRGGGATAIELLNAAERPVVLIGNGVRLGGARAEMRDADRAARRVRC